MLRRLGRKGSMMSWCILDGVEVMVKDGDEPRLHMIYIIIVPSFGTSTCWFVCEQPYVHPP